MRSRLPARAIVPGLGLVGALLTAAVPAPVAALDDPAEALPGRTVVTGSPVTSPASSHRVTLVTGDVVRLDTAENGQQSATVIRRASASGDYHTYTSHGDVYVEPGSAFGLLAAGRLDPELFNVSGLVRQGYGDETRGGLPLIVEYGGRTTLRAGRPDAPDGSRDAHVLGSLNGLAVTERKSAAATFWRDVVDGPRQSAPELVTRLDDGIAKIWLDARVHASLAESTSQIGAPTAWDSGIDGSGVTVAVLDSGIDPTHPDLADQITTTKDFIGSGDAVDRAGHGTHVASIVAGTGAASDGQERGVAPGADLMIGKVLNDEGAGTMSSVIEGMQWAAANGADVVNMSLGGPVTKGDDPMSQAVDELTADHGVLFVVAAGNSSFSQPGTRDVTAPGTAADALTVGAVSSRDFVWSGSRTGLMGDAGIKPDIVAPGVSILAARAAGTGFGDGPYTSMTGTSMATPHVAGAAALLLQQHPAWTPAQVKAELMSTAQPLDEYAVTQAGAGRVDVARAVQQRVYVDRGMLHMGYFARPYDPDRMRTSRQLTYTNDTDEAVTLELTATLSEARGDPAPDGVLTVSPSTLTIEPGGTATATVAVDATDVAAAEYTGRVTATGPDGLAVGTGVGFYKQDDMVDVTFRALDTNGQPAIARVRVDRYKDFDGRFFSDNIYFTPEQQEWTLRLPEGDYNLFGLVVTLDESGRFVEEQSIVHDPLVEVAAPNSTVTLDARTAEPVSLQTPRPSTPRGLTMMVHRGDPASPYSTSDEWYWDFVDGEPERISVASTERVDDAPFALVSQWDAGVAPLTSRVLGSGGYSLGAIYQGGPMIDGVHTVTVADVGTASPSDLQGLSLGGKAALVRESADRSWQQQIQAAVDAGAGMVILYSAEPGVFYPQIGGPVPVLALDRAEGSRLRTLAGRATPAKVQFVGTPRTPYAYDLTFVEDGQIQAPLDYRVDADDLATVKARFHTTGAGEQGWRFRAGSFEGCECGPSPTTDYVPALGYTRTEYVTADSAVSTYDAWRFLVDGWPSNFLFARDDRTYEPGDKVSEDWLKAPLSPGVANTVTTPYGMKMQVQRYGTSDFIRWELAGLTDSAGNWTTQMTGSDATVRLYQDGELLAERFGLVGGVPVPAGDAAYRLEADVDQNASVIGLSTQTRTAWTFHSAGTGQQQLLPLIDVDYADVTTAGTDDTALDLANSAPFGAEVELHLRASHQTGSSAAQVDAMRVWVSYDDGESWAPAQVDGAGDERFVARYAHPARGEYVSLRIAASDGSGNTLDQTLIRAYRLG